ncbi:hypothetical protein PtB15_8B521 [Puccinia triticina]|nr:hypothetical protein PtB15_8B521 [Puccinia triticina]
MIPITLDFQITGGYSKPLIGKLAAPEPRRTLPVGRTFQSHAAWVLSKWTLAKHKARAGRPESGPSELSPANWGTVDEAEDDPFSAANSTMSNTLPLADRPSFSRSNSRSHTPFVGLLSPATRSPVIGPSSPLPPAALFEGYQTQTDSRLSRAKGSDEIAIGANTLPEVSNSKGLGSGDTFSSTSDAILPRPRPP